MYAAELDAIVWLQAAMPAGLLPVWQALTHLGDAATLFVLIALLAWSYHPQRALHLAVALSLSGLLAGCLKLLLQAPRPWMLRADIVPLTDTGGFGMPSGHALSTAVFFGLLAVFSRRHHDASLPGASLWLVLSLLVGVSRAVLGVHSPAQILGGWTLGAVVVGLFAFVLLRLPVSARIAITSVALAILGTVYVGLLQLTLAEFSIPAEWQARYHTVYALTLTPDTLAGGARVFLISLAAGCLLALLAQQYVRDVAQAFLSVRERVLGVLLGTLVLSTLIALLARGQPGALTLHGLAIAVPIYTFVVNRWLLRQLAWRWL